MDMFRPDRAVTRRFEYKDVQSDKFWQVTIEQQRTSRVEMYYVTIKFGRNNPGRNADNKITRVHPTFKSAELDAMKRITEKLGKGYYEVPVPGQEVEGDREWSERQREIDAIEREEQSRKKKKRLLSVAELRRIKEAERRVDDFVKKVAEKQGGRPILFNTPQPMVVALAEGTSLGADWGRDDTPKRAEFIVPAANKMARYISKDVSQRIKDARSAGTRRVFVTEKPRQPRGDGKMRTWEVIERKTGETVTFIRSVVSPEERLNAFDGRPIAEFVFVFRGTQWPEEPKPPKPVANPRRRIKLGDE